MSEKKKENPVSNMVLALRQIREGGPPIVWLTFGKNILEAAFDAICSVWFIRLIYQSMEDHIEFRRLLILVSVVSGFHILVHLLSAYQNYMEKISAMKVYRHLFYG